MTEEEKRKKAREDLEDDDDLDDDDFDDEDEEEEDEDDSDDEEEEESEDENDDEEEEEEDEEEDEDDKSKDKSKSKKGDQSLEERSRQAQKRREREAKEREANEKRIREEAYLKGKLAASKVNTFTKEPIKDEYDLLVYETMVQLEAEGKDPIDDLPKRMAEINREKANKAKEEANKKKELDDRIDREFAEFESKYPGVKISKLLADPDFADYTDGRIGVGSKTLVQLYDSFNKFKTKFGGAEEEEEEDDGKRGAPSPNGGRKHEKTSYSKMSKEQKIKELRRQGLIN